MRFTLIRGANRISNYPHNDSPRRGSRNGVAYVRQPRWTYSRRYIRRNRVVSPMGEEDTPDILHATRKETCVRAYNVAPRTLSRRTATRPRGRMEKYESFLWAINASAYSQGRSRARCCIHLSGGAVAVSPSRYVRNNFVKPGEPDRACKKGFEKRIHRPK